MVSFVHWNVFWIVPIMTKKWKDLLLSKVQTEYLKYYPRKYIEKKVKTSEKKIDELST